MGIRHLVLAVNKMDLVGFERAAFDEICDKLCAVSPASSASAHFACVPVSARDGDNIAARSTRMPWYAGPPLLERLETVEVA